jgi:hypothetical protein
LLCFALLCVGGKQKRKKERKKEWKKKPLVTSPNLQMVSGTLYDGCVGMEQLHGINIWEDEYKVYILCFPLPSE